MSIKSLRLVAFCVLLLVFGCGLLRAQMTVTGSIAGAVVDPSGKAVAGAKVILTSENNKTRRNGVANESGAFSLVALEPGVYSVRIEHPGFKSFERTGLVVSANERIALGDVTLAVGAVSETVTVEAKSAHVETDTAESSAEITTDQIGNLTARGRDVVSMLRTIPGGYYQADQDSAGGSYGTASTRDPRGQQQHEHPLGRWCGEQ